MAEVTGHLLASGTEVMESQIVPIQSANDASGRLALLFLRIALRSLMLCAVHQIASGMERAARAQEAAPINP